MRPVLAFLPVDLLGEVDRRARDAGVSRAEMLGHILADAVPRLFAEQLARLPHERNVLDVEVVDERENGANATTVPKLATSGPSSYERTRIADGQGSA